MVGDCSKSSIPKVQMQMFLYPFCWLRGAVVCFWACYLLFFVEDGGMGKRESTRLRYLRILEEVERNQREGRVVGLGRILREHGFSDQMSRNPQKVTSSKTWQELVNEKLSDSKVLDRLAEGLDATRIHSSPTEPDREVPDHTNRRGYVELALKVKGRLQEAGSTVVAVQVNLDPKRQNNLKSVFVDGE